MAQGETNSGGGKHFYVAAKNLKSGVTDYPYLELKWKENGAYETKSVSWLSGHIISIEKIDEQKTLPGTPKPKRMRGVKFTMKDSGTGEHYHFDVLYSNPVRELLNRMGSLESFEEELKITPYRGEKGFAGVSLKRVTLSGDVKVEAAYGYEEYIKPRKKVVVFQGQEQTDYTLVDDFYDELITRKLSQLRLANFTGSFTPAPTPAPTPQVIPQKENVSENVVNTSNSNSNSNNWEGDLPF